MPRRHAGPLPHPVLHQHLSWLSWRCDTGRSHKCKQGLRVTLLRGAAGLDLTVVAVSITKMRSAASRLTATMARVIAPTSGPWYRSGRVWMAVAVAGSTGGIAVASWKGKCLSAAVCVSVSLHLLAAPALCCLTICSVTASPNVTQRNRCIVALQVSRLGRRVLDLGRPGALPRRRICPPWFRPSRIIMDAPATRTWSRRPMGTRPRA